MFSLHGKIALVTLAFLGIAAVGLLRPSHPGETTGQAVTITVAHTVPVTLALSLTEGTSRSLVDIDQTSPETISLDVPDTWKRTEVRRAPLATVTSENAGASGTRWKLPANAGISFSSDASASDIIIKNPSAVTVKIQVTRVNLLKNTSSYDVYLLKDGSLTLP